MIKAGQNQRKMNDFKNKKKFQNANRIKKKGQNKETTKIKK